MSKSEQLQIRVTPLQKATLKRLAATAGQNVSEYVLSKAIPSAKVRFADILRSLREAENARFALAELNDFIAELAPIEFADAVAHADVGEFSPFVQNYVVAMVEQAASMKGVAPPGWVDAIEPLDTPYFAAPLRSLHLHLLKASPVPFKRRNLFVDAGVGARV